MPVFRIDDSDHNRRWGIWHVTEEEEDLVALITPHEEIPANIQYHNKRLEFAAGRALVKLLLEDLGFSFAGVGKDDFGKPLLKGLEHKVSLSHSFPYVAAIINDQNEMGIDIEQPTPKLFRIGPRVLHVSELRDADKNLNKHCIYWCAKEAMMKVYGKRNLVFSENLIVDPFNLADEGNLYGKVIVNEEETAIDLHYHVLPEFIVVYSK